MQAKLLILLTLLAAATVAAGAPGGQEIAALPAMPTALDAARSDFVVGLDEAERTPIMPSAGNDTWFWYAGEELLHSHHGDFGANTGCTNRLLDDCASPITTTAIGHNGKRALYGSQLSDSPSDDSLGQVVLVTRPTGVAQAIQLTGVPELAGVGASSGYGYVVAREPAPVGGAQSTLVQFLDLRSNSLFANGKVSLGGTPIADATGQGGTTALVATTSGLFLVDANNSSPLTQSPPSSQINALAANAGLTFAATAHESGDAALLQTGSPAPLFVRKLGGAATTVALDETAQWTVFGDATGKVHLFRGPLGPASYNGSLTLDSTPITGLAMSGDGSLIGAATANRVALLSVYNATLETVWVQEAADAKHLAMTEDGTLIVAFASNVTTYPASSAVTVQVPEFVLGQQDSKRLNATFTNTGVRSVNLSLAIDFDVGWFLDAQPASLTIPVGESRDVELFVVSPEKIGPGTHEPARINYTLEGKPFTVPIPVTIRQVTAVAVIPSGPDSADIEPGSQVTFGLTIANRGNTDANINLELMRPNSAWSATLSRTAYQLAPGQTENGTLTIRAPSNAKQGDMLRVEITHELAKRPVAITAVVGANYDFAMQVPQEVPIEAGKQAKFDVKITNQGNAPDSYKLFVQDAMLPAGWTARIEGGSVDIITRDVQPAEQRVLRVIVTAPRDAPDDGLIELKLAANSLGDGQVRSDQSTWLKLPQAPEIVPPETETPGFSAVLGIFAILGALLLGFASHRLRN